MCYISAQMKHLFQSLVVLPVLFSVLSGVAFALPESTVDQIKADYSNKILPFFETGVRFPFKTFDGLELSAIRFVHPNSVGTIVVINGRSESFLKYGEVFYDLFQKGYSIYSYDHRGQGLSPHLSFVNPQIGHVRNFKDYVRDLDTFVNEVVVPNTAKTEKLFLLSHSMGGAISAAYLSQAGSKAPFQKAILSSPMLQIKLPYPEFISKAIVEVECLAGRGKRYTVGQGNYDDNAQFGGKDNIYTGSEARFWLTDRVFKDNPSAKLGGPSNRWVNESITATHRIRNEMNHIKVPFILFQAENDQVVMNAGENSGCARANTSTPGICTEVIEKGARHEIWMEQDAIRDDAFAHLYSFFQ